MSLIKSKKAKIIALIVWLIAAIYLVLLGLKVTQKIEGKSFSDYVKSVFQISKYTDVKNLVKTELVEEESTTIEVVERVSPAVVSVIVKTINFDLFTGPSLRESGIGTGFIVDSNGLIVTNSHVVDNSRGEYSVVLKDGTTYPVDKIHLDTVSDLAIIEITARDLPIVELGDSDDLKVGQKAIAIGNALGRFQNTVTVGVVSGIGRNLLTSGGFGTKPTIQENAIQTDAALNPGNSGGPLLNSSGQVIGINVATTVGADNISFAVPVNTLKPLLETFSKEGRIIRPYIGISYTMISKEIAGLRDMPVGAYITSVIKDSPAENAQLKRGDIITTFDGRPVNEEYSIAKAVSEKRVGDKVKLEIDREGEKINITVELEESPEGF